MRNVWLAVLGLVAACGGSNPTRYFRVLYPATTTGSLPDSCYQAATLAAPSNPDEQAAQSYCMVGKKSTSSGSTSNLVTSQSWTMVDTSDSKLYLVLEGTTASTGIEGKLEAGRYLFDATTSSFTKQCTGATSATECNGTCVNRFSDPANCGSCGFACPSGQFCRFGSCQAMCSTPIMQTCNAVLTNTQIDDANCGTCGRACAAPQICSNGACVDPCAAGCDRYTAGSCGMPRQFSRESKTTIDFEVRGGALSGTVAQSTSFACTAPGCSGDFAQRCPSCSYSNAITGRELNNVTEFEQR